MIFVFFFNDTATTEIYTLSLHDALPIFGVPVLLALRVDGQADVSLSGLSAKTFELRVNGSGDVRARGRVDDLEMEVDRKSTRLNSSHANISYAVFCLKKKNHILAHIMHS